MEPTAPSSPLAPATPQSIAGALAGALRPRTRYVVTDIADCVPAAVLIPVFVRGGEPWLIFTRRSQSVKHHKGEISFPGGARDPQDVDLRATAVRETVEEIGLEETAIQAIGELDDFLTHVTNFVVTPVVAIVQEQAGYAHSVHEVHEVIELPIRPLAAAVRVEDWTDRGRPFPMYFFELDGYTIWGVTGYILRSFLEVAGEALGLPAPAPGPEPREVPDPTEALEDDE